MADLSNDPPETDAARAGADIERTTSDADWREPHHPNTRPVTDEEKQRRDAALTTDDDEQQDDSVVNPSSS